MPVNNFPVADTKFSALGLKEGQVLEFRVSAVNQGGTGKPSKSTKPHTVKDPICKCTSYFCSYRTSCALQ